MTSPPLLSKKGEEGLPFLSLLSLPVSLIKKRKGSPPLSSLEEGETGLTFSTLRSKRGEERLPTSSLLSIMGEEGRNGLFPSSNKGKEGEGLPSPPSL